MTVYAGALVLIKIGDGANPEQFTTIGGLKAAQITIDTQTLDASTVESGQWRQLAGGPRSLSIRGSGIFTNSSAEEALRQAAFSGSAPNFQFVFGNGGNVTGAFLVTQYERSGDVEDEEIYMLAMESAGAVTYGGS